MTDKRGGDTIVSSVSISKEFKKLIDEYNISPTECFRRGVAVTLCDLGVGMYQSPKNEERLKYVNEFMKRIEESENLREQFNKIDMFEKLNLKMAELQKILDSIKSNGG